MKLHYSRPQSTRFLANLTLLIFTIGIVSSIILILVDITSKPPVLAAGGNVVVTPQVLDLSGPEIMNPFRGFYQWYGHDVVPLSGPTKDHYARFNWRDIEPAKGQYNFTLIDQELEKAWQVGARFGFRMIALDSFEAQGAAPAYLMAETPGTWCNWSGGAGEVNRLWVPNWDSAQFLQRAQALVTALGARYNGDPRLAYYDLGLYGHYGEWQVDKLCTPDATQAIKRTLVDMQLAAFPDSWVTMNPAGTDADPFVYALGKSSKVGVRADSLGDPWFEQQFIDNPAKGAALQDRWKTAPFIAEFVGGNNIDFAMTADQVKRMHVVAVANGNNLNWAALTAVQQANLVLTGKNAGYRFVLNSLTYPSQVTVGSALTISSQWSNVGNTPLYEKFNVTLELRRVGQSQVVWSRVSSLNLSQFLPTTTPATINDQWTIPATLPPGHYELSLVVLDSTGYRSPLALAIQGMDAQGRFKLGNINLAFPSDPCNAQIVNNSGDDLPAGQCVFTLRKALSLVPAQATSYPIFLATSLTNSPVQPGSNLVIPANVQLIADCANRITINLTGTTKLSLSGNNWVQGLIVTKPASASFAISGNNNEFRCSSVQNKP